MIFPLLFYFFKVKGSIFYAFEDIISEVGDDWNWLEDGVTGEKETPKSLLEKAKRFRGNP